MKTKHCPSNRELTDFDLGDLPNQRYEEVSQHLDSCADCAMRFESLVQTSDPMLSHLRLELPAEILQEDSEIERLVGIASALRDTSASVLDDTINGDLPPRKPNVDELAKAILKPAESADELGRLDGYRVLEVLGVGGMGVVFKAKDVSLKRLVALKVMLPHLAVPGDLSVERFLREAQAAAAITHDNIVTIHQVGKDGDIAFLAMQLLHGQSLSERLARETQLPIADVCRITRETAEGLSAAHDKGLMHRDIKPENIWLETNRHLQRDQHAEAANQTATTRVKIVDFGLARAADEQSNLTQTGEIVGTPSYLAPEQVRGLPVDSRADLFSLGVVMYQMLTGIKPFQRVNTLATLRAIDSDTPSAPSEIRNEVPPELSDLVMKLLEKDPQERLQTAHDVVVTIESIENPQETSRTSAAPVVAFDSANPPRSRNVMIAAAGAFFLLLMGVIITLKDKDGNLIAKIFAKNADSVSVDPAPDVPTPINVDEDEDVVMPKKGVGANTNEINGTADVLSPLSRSAIVQDPRQLVSKSGESVEGWDIVPKELVSKIGSVAALSDDGKLLAHFGMDSNIRIFDIDTGKRTNILVGHAAGPCKLTGRFDSDYHQWTSSRHYGPLMWSPLESNTRLLASASRDGTVRVWDAEKARTVHEFDSGDDNISMISWSPDGDLLAAATHDGVLHCWETKAWSLVASSTRLKGNSALAMTWNAGGTPSRLAICWQSESNVAGLTVWTPEKDDHEIIGDELAVPIDCRFGLPPIRWSRGGQSLAIVAGNDVRILNADTWQSVKTIKNEDRVPLSVCWSHDSQQLLVLWEDEVTLHGLDSSDVDWRMKTEAHANHRVDWSPDGRTFRLGDRLYDAESREPLREDILGVQEWTTNGKLCLTYESDSRATTVWDVSDLDEPTRVMQVQAERQEPMGGQAMWDPLGRFVYLDTSVANSATLLFLSEPLVNQQERTGFASIVGWTQQGLAIQRQMSGDGLTSRMRFLEPRTVKVVQEFDVPHPFKGWDISPDGKRLAIGRGIGSHGTEDPDEVAILVFDINSGTELTRWPMKQHRQLPSIAWSHDGSMIVVENGTNPPTAQVMNANNGEVIATFNTRQKVQNSFNRLRWSPDDQYILIPGSEELSVFSAKDGRYINGFAIQCDLSVGSTGGAYYFENNHSLLCGSHDGNLYRLNLTSGAQELMMSGVGRAVQFSHDGKKLAVEDAGVCKIKQVENGKTVVSFLRGATQVTPIAISPQGHVWSPQMSGGSFWASNAGVTNTLLYVVKTATGQHTLTPLEFDNTYNWQNEPNRVRLK